MRAPRPLMQRAAGWRAWLAQNLSAGLPAGKHSLVVAASLVFVVGFGVRLLHWQDSHAEIGRRDAARTGLEFRYRYDAQRIVEEKSILYPATQQDPGDARLIVHPPGYSMLVAAVAGDKVRSGPYTTLRFVQIGFDSVSAVLVLLIAARFMPIAAATIAGMLAAFSPHLAYYSLWLTPESVAVTPVLIAVYLIVLAIETPRLSLLVAAGIALGVSCWLRSNGLLLAPFLSLVSLLLYDRRNRLRCAMALLLASLVTIAPITIRNWLLYHRLIPLSLGAGITMIEGIADYDAQNRFGFPRDDEQAALKDAEWHGRPDYGDNLWVPDGPQRDSERFRRGLAVVGANPCWFFGVMLRRASFMLRYNDSGSSSWPLNTALVPVVSREPGYSHSVIISDSDGDERGLVWATSPLELVMNGTILSPEAASSATPDGTILEITGDYKEYADQFESAPIQLERNHDYLFRLKVVGQRGLAAAKVTTVDRRITLSSCTIPESAERRQRNSESAGPAKRADTEKDSEKTKDDQRRLSIIEIPFASNDKAEVRLVLSNNGTPRSVTAIGTSRLFDVGPTAYLWTRPLRFPVRAIQRNIYTTPRMLILIAMGISVLAVAPLNRALLALVAVPAYYLTAQSVFHTEYRYILTIHYFLFVFAGVAIYLGGKLIEAACRSITKGLRKQSVAA